jgi:pimeloyl-ACP methyl ester carboxylesterase
MTQNIACNDASLITSIDGVTIAMHDFGGTGSPVLLSHATGFHGHCWEPVAHALNSQHHVVALDHRGYGDAETVDPTTMTWDQYGLDALAAARHLYAQHNEPIIGIGHSMGGASLLMAAHSEPHLFKALFVFEPIVFPPPNPDAGERPSSPLPAGARKRRSRFPSFEAAIDNFAAKPPMASFNAEAREAYVRHGFKPTAEGDIELKCLPEHEARTYETGGTSGAWDSLPAITTPVWVLSGALAPFQPSTFAITVAERIPASTYVRWDEVGHFGPLEKPELIVQYVTSVAATLS